MYSNLFMSEPSPVGMEIKGNRIHTIAFVSRRGAIVKNMAKM
jgi:hypothetical protein